MPVAYARAFCQDQLQLFVHFDEGMPVTHTGVSMAADAERGG
jgi:hypothetical protein